MFMGLLIHAARKFRFAMREEKLGVRFRFHGRRGEPCYSREVRSQADVTHAKYIRQAKFLRPAVS